MTDVFVLNKGLANELTLPCQVANRGQPVFIGDVSPSYSGIERNSIRGHRRTHNVVLSFVDTATETWARQIVADDAQIPCGGALFGTGVWLCSVTIGQSRMVPGTSPILWEASATVREVLPNWAILKYTPGDTLTGETFARSTTATYFDANGILQTAGVNVKRDAHYVNGVRTTLLETTRTNVVLWNRDLTNAAWVKTGCTVVRNGTGIDGVASSCSTVTATAPNATILQSITLASSQRAQTAYVQRGVGTGTVQMTMDGGATWTTLPLATFWIRFTIPSQTIANPQIGFKIFTSGDSIAVDFVQNENGQNPSSPIATTSAAVTRASDFGTSPAQDLPQAQTWYAKIIVLTDDSAQHRIARRGNTDSNCLVFYLAGGAPTFYHNNGTTASQSANTNTPAVGDTIEFRGVLLSTGAVYTGVSKNGGAETVSATSGPLAFSAAWVSQTLEFPPSSSEIFNLLSFKRLRGERTLAECRAQ